MTPGEWAAEIQNRLDDAMHGSGWVPEEVKELAETATALLDWQRAIDESLTEDPQAVRDAAKLTLLRLRVQPVADELPEYVASGQLARDIMTIIGDES